MGRNSSRANERRLDLGDVPLKDRLRGERKWDPLPQEKREGVNDSSWGREREPCQKEVSARSNFDVPIKKGRRLVSIKEHDDFACFLEATEKNILTRGCCSERRKK